MSKKYKLKSLEQVCPGCPMIWEGWTEDNLFVFIRYRWGSLRVLIGKTPGEDYKGQQEDYDKHPSIFDDSTRPFEEELGDKYDGSMSDIEMMNHLKDVFDFSLITAVDKE
jgi:hypothetical protein